jgi:hypothetical protein
MMSAKNIDKKNRLRNQIVAFRISPAEKQILDSRILFSGCQTKQDYLIQCVLETKIKAIGNPYMFIQFRKHLEYIIYELRRVKAFLINKDKSNKIYKNNNHIAIDCGAAHGGKLAIYCINNDEEIYI